MASGPQDVRLRPIIDSGLAFLAENLAEYKHLHFSTCVSDSHGGRSYVNM
jgi:hypothetical protein